MAVHSIGTGGSFSTPQAWEDDIPGTLTEDRIGELKNQVFSAGGSDLLTISGHTTGAFEIILRCETGASYNDNVNARTNALRYNASNGAAFHATADYTRLIYFTGNVAKVTIQDIQFRLDAPLTSSIFSQSLHANSKFKNLLIEKSATAASYFGGIYSEDPTATNLWINCLCIDNYAGISAQAQWVINSVAINCTFVRPSNHTAIGVGVANYFYTVSKVTNCLFFGYLAEVVTAGFLTTSDYNGTSFSDAGSALPDPATDHNVYSVAYTATSIFENADASGGAHDFRLKSSASSLVGAAPKDTTNAPSDISKFTRLDPTSIGAWEPPTAGGGGQPGRIGQRLDLRLKLT